MHARQAVENIGQVSFRLAAPEVVVFSGYPECPPGGKGAEE